MEKSKRMAPVVQVTESREEKAAQEFGRCQRQLKEQQNQLEQLQLYKREYQNQLQAKGRVGITVAQILQTQRFLAQLDTAIAQQQNAIEQTTRLCIQKRNAWLAARTRSGAVNKAVERMVAEEQRRSDKREQKELDERAQRPRKDEAE